MSDSENFPCSGPKRTLRASARVPCMEPPRPAAGSRRTAPAPPAPFSTRTPHSSSSGASSARPSTRSPKRRGVGRLGLRPFRQQGGAVPRARRACGRTVRALHGPAAEDPSPLQRVLNLGAAYVEFAISETRRVPHRLDADVRSLGLGRRPRADLRAHRRAHPGTIGRMRTDLQAAAAAGEIEPIEPDRAMIFLWGSWSGVLALALRDAPLTVQPDEIRATLQSEQRYSGGPGRAPADRSRRRVHRRRATP